MVDVGGQGRNKLRSLNREYISQRVYTAYDEVRTITSATERVNSTTP